MQFQDGVPAIEKGRKMDTNKTIILIRHGKTAYNALGKYMGRGVDEELSDDGIKEIIAKRDGLRAISEGAVIFTVLLNVQKIPPD